MTSRIHDGNVYKASEGHFFAMNKELDLTKDLSDDDSLLSVEDEDDDTKEALRAYIG